MPALFYESVSSDYSFFNPDTHLPSPPALSEAVAFALQKYPGYKFLPSNYDIVDVHAPNTSPSTTHFSCDDFRMYEFKVRRCMRGRSHDWTECPYAHPGEKARRRDPKRIHYSGVPCPDFRKGSCRRGDACEFAHGVFECWLHPARYRTQVCKDGKNCRRRVCFFAHSPEQLRILPSSMASAPASMHTHTDTSDGSPVGSPRASPQMKVSSEIPTSHTVVATSSVGTAMSRAIPPSSSMAALSLPNTFMSNLDLQVSPISLHFDSLNGSPLRRAMAQNFLVCKGYGGGSFNLSVAQAEYSSSVYDGGYEGPAGGELAFSPRCSFEGHEGEYPKLSLPLGPLDKSKYEFASHGFGSPTSTLAAHAFSPPPLSPPLSPLSSPNSDKPKGTFANPFNNFYVDDTISSSTNNNQSSYMYNTNCLEDLAFRLQHLQIPESFNHPDSLNRVSHSRQILLESRQGMLEMNPLQSSHSRPPSLRHISHGLSCAPRQSMWSPLSDFASSKDDGVTFLHMKDASVRMAGKVYGEESSNIDNLIPDVGWVSELVK